MSITRTTTTITRHTVAIDLPDLALPSSRGARGSTFIPTRMEETLTVHNGKPEYRVRFVGPLRTKGGRPHAALRGEIVWGDHWRAEQVPMPEELATYPLGRAPLAAAEATE